MWVFNYCNQLKVALMKSITSFVIQEDGLKLAAIFIGKKICCNIVLSSVNRLFKS